jgi:hypothetical protein
MSAAERQAKQHRAADQKKISARLAHQTHSPHETHSRSIKLILSCSKNHESAYFVIPESAYSAIKVLLSATYAL